MSSWLTFWPLDQPVPWTVLRVCVRVVSLGVTWASTDNETVDKEITDKRKAPVVVPDINIMISFGKEIEENRSTAYPFGGGTVISVYLMGSGLAWEEYHVEWAAGGWPMRRLVMSHTASRRRTEKAWDVRFSG